MLDAPAPSLAVTAGFVVLVVAVVACIVAAVPAAARGCGEQDWTGLRRRRAIGVGLAAWLVVTWLVAWSGLLARFDLVPPPLLLFVGATGIASTALALSRIGAMFAHGLPVATLVGFHAFRVPLEIALHELGVEGVLPVQMTWDGMNYDVVSGVTAALVAVWAARGTLPRIVLLAWNLLGLALLFVIVAVAIVSAPVPFRVFMNEPANTLVTTAPFVWLPTVLVQAAWIGHLLVFRRLAGRRR